MSEKSSKSQRRSPKQARAQATWEAIVEAAAQILERGGADALNTNDVAERAGVSIGTLYQYFPDKRAILLAAARRELAPLAGRQKALIQALIDMVGRLGAAPKPARAQTSTAARAAAPRRRRPSRWERECADAIEQLTALLLAPFEAAPTPILIRIRPRR